VLCEQIAGPSYGPGIGGTTLGDEASEERLYIQFLPKEALVTTLDPVRDVFCVRAGVGLMPFEQQPYRSI